MCGFDAKLFFEFAIFLVVVVGLILLVQWALPNAFAIFSGGGRFGPVVQIVIGVVVVVMIIGFIWKMAKCSGLLHAGYKPLFPGRGA